MLNAVFRKAGQVARDPVLRRWLAGAAVGRNRRPPRFTPHAPPYLKGLARWEGGAGLASQPFKALDSGPPQGALKLALPGETIEVEPAEASALFEREFADTETLLALHRFAWLPLLGGDADPGWVDLLWRHWAARFGTVDSGWAWHPYNAAERAINLLDYAARQGLPGDGPATLELLHRHGPAILERLEYFGDHHTSNHLSNNGRGLFHLGLALGEAHFADVGGRILLAEAARIFSPSGVLREGSTHYHLLLARNYAGAWLAARAHDRAEAGTLEDITRRALEVLPHLVLPGGMPLVGDVSPDCPPEFLAGLLPGGDGAHGWCGLLPAKERDALDTLKQRLRTASADRLAEDGWLRFSAAPWSALFHAAPEGWIHMPGHGHQDVAGFELHFDALPVLIDPGRGAYGEGGEALDYVAAGAHNNVTVDHMDPYPANRPYYDAAFRRSIGGVPPCIERGEDGIGLRHDGFARLKGVGGLARRFRFDGRRFRIEDRLEGAGRHTITRRLHTTLAVSLREGGAILEGDGVSFRLSTDGPLALLPGKQWTAYGRSVPATVIEMTQEAALPLETALTVEAG